MKLFAILGPLRLLILLLLFSIKTKAQATDNDIIKTILTIKGVNYYPQQSPWDTFGESFDEPTLREDFILIRNMGLNTIRIFIQYDDFGRGNPHARKVKRLNTLMRIASEEGLKVMVTLFDFYGNYNPEKWEENQRHLATLVSSLKDHSNLLAWDLKNEPDLDFESRGKETVLNWLKSILSELRQLDKRHLITIGWSNPESALNLNEEVDFVCFHYYRDLKNLSKDYGTLSSTTNKPVVLQEYGFSSYSGFSNLFSSSEKKQAAYFEEVSKLVSNNRIPNLFWTLYDYDKIPQQVVGDKPRHQKKQMRFGVIGRDKKKKQAFHYVSTYEGLLHFSLQNDY